jgi:hypothetical protein
VAQREPAPGRLEPGECAMTAGPREGLTTIRRSQVALAADRPGVVPGTHELACLQLVVSQGRRRPGKQSSRFDLQVVLLDSPTGLSRPDSVTTTTSSRLCLPELGGCYTR